MCTGVELGAIAAVAGGAGYGLNKRADNNLSDRAYRIMAETDAKADALKMVRAQEQQKQQALQEAANQQTGQVIEGFSSEKQKRQIEEQQAKATQALQLAPEFIQASTPVTPTDSTAPAVVQEAINRRLSESTAKAGGNAERFGALQGFDASNFLNSLALTSLANNQATSGVLSQSSKNVADQADQVRDLVNSIGQGRLDMWAKQNATGGVRQAAQVSDQVRNAALFAALTGGVGSKVAAQGPTTTGATVSGEGFKRGVGGIASSPTSFFGLF